MLFSPLAYLFLVTASVAATPTPSLDARASTETIYMRIEGPTKTIYEKTIQASPQTTLANNGHTATCDGTPETAAGVTSLVALQETGQSFTADWNGTVFGYVTHINGTTNSAENQWGALFNNVGPSGTGGIVLQGYDDGTNTEYESFCYQTLPDKQHFLFAYFGDIDSTNFMFMSGPKTAAVGQTVKYTVPFATDDAYVNDLSVDTTTGQRVFAEFGTNNGADASVSIKFTQAGTYNMKAHCPSGSACVRSNHVVTVVS
jgi:hypothetical protein